MYLNNTAFLMKEKKELNIVCIGGSVTEGYGSTDKKEKSWPVLVGRWMEQTYGVRVNLVNAGIGGTSSSLGNYRFDAEIAPAKPDLFFIEFAVNDFYDGFDYRTTRRYSESLLAKAYRLNPNMDVVYILTYDLHYDNKDYPQLRAHRDIADRNGLLSVKMSDFIYERCAKTGENPHDFYIDWVHPNDLGYKTYAEIIEGILAEDLKQCKNPTQMIPHKPITVSDELLTNSRFLTGEAAYDLHGFTYQKPTSPNGGIRGGGALIAEEPGSSFKFDFEGTDLGLFFTAGTNRGKLKIVVDGREQAIADTYLWHENCNEKQLFACLTPEKHTVEVTVSEEKNGNSSGTHIEINAFLVC